MFMFMYMVEQHESVEMNAFTKKINTIRNPRRMTMNEEKI